MFNHLFPACTLLKNWRLARAHEIHSLCQDQTTMAQRVAMNVAKCYLTSCVWTHLWIRSHTLCPDSGTVRPLRLCWVKGVCAFGCNLPPALLAEWSGSFTCRCSNTGVERTPNKCQYTKLTLEKKILLLLLPGFALADFRSPVWHFFRQAIPAVPSRQVLVRRRRSNFDGCSSH